MATPIIIPEMKTIQFNGPRSIQASSPCSIIIGMGYTHHRTYLQLGGSLGLDDILGIEVLLDGVTVRDLGSGSNLDRMNQYFNLPTFASNNILCISHLREGLRRFVETHSTAIGMSAGGRNPESLEIRLMLGPDTPSTSTINVFGMVSAPKDTILILREKRDVFEFSTNGEKVMDKLFEKEEVLDQMFFEQTDCAIDQMRIKYNEKDIYFRPEALDDYIFESSIYRTKMADLWVFDKSENGFGKEPMVYGPSGRFEVSATLSGITDPASIMVRKRTISNW